MTACLRSDPTALQGFFAADSPHAAANPGDWATQTGQSFRQNHDVPGIDFATVRSMLFGLCRT